MALRILSQAVDGTTGYLRMVVRVEDPATGSHGPEETLVIAPHALRARFHAPGVEPTKDTMADAVQSWLAAHHGPALARKQHADHVRALAGDLTGKLLCCEPEPAPESAPAPSEAANASS